MCALLWGMGDWGLSRDGDPHGITGLSQIFHGMTCSGQEPRLFRR